MTLPSLATTDELAAWLGVTLSGSDLSRAVALLDGASALIRAEAGQDWIVVGSGGDELDDVPAEINTVTVQVAARAYKNPEGATQASVGDVSVSYGASGGGNALALSASDKAIIRRSVGRSSAGSIELVSPWAGEVALYYVPVAGGGDPFPMGPFPWEVW